jgi:Uma2 family endonuclease
MHFATSPKLLTADEFWLLPARGECRELRRGIAVVMNPSGFRHSEVCGNLFHHLGHFVRERQLGRLLPAGNGILVERHPDTVRAADLAYYSFERVPKGQSPTGPAANAPEIVFEIASPTNTRTEIALKTGEFLRAGVKVVCVVDPQFGTVNLHYADRPSTLLKGDDSLTFDELRDFQLPVRLLFE